MSMLTIDSMPNLYFASDQHNYIRFLTYFLHFIKHTEKIHSGEENLLRDEPISVPHSYVPGNKCHTDKIIKEATVKSHKSKSG